MKEIVPETPMFDDNKRCEFCGKWRGTFPGHNGFSEMDRHILSKHSMSESVVNSLSIQKRKHIQSGGKMSDFEPKEVTKCSKTS